VSRVADEREDGKGAAPSAGAARSSLLDRLVTATRAVADADPTEIESTALRLGASRRYLAPVAWAAGALVLLVRGVKLLFLNWRLTLIEFVPAAWLWLVMWDLKQHALRHASFRHFTVAGTITLFVIAIAASIASFWCNTVFGFAIGHPRPRIAPAARQARPFLLPIVGAGFVLGTVLALSAIGIPRVNARWLYLAWMGALYAVMLTSFVVVPARIIGLRKQKLPPRQALGRLTVGGALSAIAMTPGFVLDRIGLILIGTSHLRILGLVLLSIGTALYAAGMSSVRAVKLTMKFDAPR
jgi:hypothetical protein